LVSQGCQDSVLLAVASNKDADKPLLSFVHIVKNDGTKANQHTMGSKNFNAESEIEADRNEVTDLEKYDVCDDVNGNMAGGSSSCDEYEFK